MTDRHDTPSVNPSPIPTEYAGHQFRSRLEARWAVFFDQIGVEWYYEAEGYELPSGRYLPDFYLPEIDGGAWFEVKGQQPNNREQAVAYELAKQTGLPCYVAWGQMPKVAPVTWSRRFDIELNDDSGWDNHHYWCLCAKCGKPGLEYDGRGWRICRGHGAPDDSAHFTGSLKLSRAYEFAAAYTFWSPNR